MNNASPVNMLYIPTILVLLSSRLVTVICEAAALAVATVIVWVLMFISVVLYFSLVKCQISHIKFHAEFH